METRAQKAKRLAKQAEKAEEAAEKAAEEAAVAPSAPAKRKGRPRKVRKTNAQKREKHDAQYYIDKYTKKYGMSAAKKDGLYTIKKTVYKYKKDADGKYVKSKKTGKRKKVAAKTVHYHFNPQLHKWMVKVPAHKVPAHTIKAHWQVLNKTPRRLFQKR